jgi:hypothetical protein
MAKRPHDWARDIGRIRQLLSQLLRECAESREPVAEILDLLEKLETALRSAPAAGGSGETGPAEPRHRRNKPKTYRVEHHGNVAYLAEYREGGRQPYLCPQTVYDDLAAKMAEASEPAHFEVLLEAVSESPGRHPPDYLLRMCIRFWMGSNPPLVEKVRTRYRPIRPSKFVQESRRAWRQLAQADDE